MAARPGQSLPRTPYSSPMTTAPAPQRPPRGNGQCSRLVVDGDDVTVRFGEGERSVASRRVELLQAELDCIRWLDVLADFGPDGVSQDPGGQDCEHVAQAGDGPADDETHLKCSRGGARASRENCSRNLGPASGAAVCLGDGSTVVDGDTS